MMINTHSPKQLQLCSLASIILSCLIALSAALFSSTALATPALPEFSATYGIEKFNMKLAEAHYQLSYTDRGYKFTQNTKLHGFASMFANDTVSAISYIDKSNDNLLLTKHQYTQTGREENKDEDINILWQTPKNTLRGKITGIVRSKTIEHKIDAEIWDALSFQIPLMIEANENIKQYPYQAILKGEIDTYNFVLSAVKMVTFANKEYRTLQLIRTDPKRNRQLHIWLLPELHNIPYRIINYRDGKEHSRGQLESVSFNNQKPITQQPTFQQQTDTDDDF